MINRRSFFTRLLPAVVGVPVAAAPSTPPTAISINRVLCPKCFWEQPLPTWHREFPDNAARERELLTPRIIRCYSSQCDWEGWAVFARKVI